MLQVVDLKSYIDKQEYDEVIAALKKVVVTAEIIRELDEKSIKTETNMDDVSKKITFPEYVVYKGKQAIQEDEDEDEKEEDEKLKNILQELAKIGFHDNEEIPQSNQHFLEAYLPKKSPTLERYNSSPKGNGKNGFHQPEEKGADPNEITTLLPKDETQKSRRRCCSIL